MSSPGNPNDRSFFDDSSFPDGSPYAGGSPFPPSQPFAAPAPAGGRGGTPTSLIVAIAAVVVTLLLVVGVAVGMMMNRGDGSANASGGNGGNGGVDPVAQPTTITTGDAAPETVTVTEEAERAPETTTVRETTRERSSSSDDLGTGRSDVDSRGWIGYYTRCDRGHEALAVLRTHDGDGNLTLAVACETAGGYKYYRGLNGSNPIEMDVIVDEGDRIVGQNGSWKYQMSPANLIITQNNVVKYKMTTEVWGQR